MSRFPKDDEAIATLARASGLTISAAFLPGVRDNLALLERYVTLIEAVRVSDREELASTYDPSVST